MLPYFNVHVLYKEIITKLNKLKTRNNCIMIPLGVNPRVVTSSPLNITGEIKMKQSFSAG